MTEPTSDLRGELRSACSVGLINWLRRTFVRGSPRARVIAPSAVCLGASLEVDWWFFCQNGPQVSLITVSLVGMEIARRRISARTGISVVTEMRPFLTLEIDRQVPDCGSPVTSGQAEAKVPLRSAPSLAGRLNEIAWAVVVQASFGASTVVRQEFPLIVLPVSS